MHYIALHTEKKYIFDWEIQLQFYNMMAGLILGLHLANERQHYFVTTSLNINYFCDI